MPIVHFDLVDNHYDQNQVEQLITQATALYAEVLDAPIDRIRVYVNLYPATQVGVGGRISSVHQMYAPFFEFMVLEGRPIEQRHRLGDGFTDLLVSILGVDRALVRGQSRSVNPEDWFIAGKPAAQIRQSEISERAQTA